MKIDRLVSIIIILLRRDRIQARELAEMFDVSVRTILRDIDTINLAGIPIVTYQGANGGISIAEGYRLDKSVLSADDMAAIISALKGINASLPDNRFDVLMEKLKNPLSASQLNSLDQKTRQIIIDLSPWGDTKQLREKKLLLHHAIEKCLEISFSYVDGNGTKTTRKVEPYSLILKGQSWYLYGWCLLREDFRLFKLARIKHVTLTDKVYNPRTVPVEQIPWEKQWLEKASLVELDLLFDREMEAIVEDCFGEDIIKRDDGMIMVKIFLPENNWLYGYLLSFGSGVEVINPPHIRCVLAEISAAINKKYSS